jgi:hypothetical protein
MQGIHELVYRPTYISLRMFFQKWGSIQPIRGVDGRSCPIKFRAFIFSVNVTIVLLTKNDTPGNVYGAVDFCAV